MWTEKWNVYVCGHLLILQVNLEMEHVSGNLLIVQVNLEMLLALSDSFLNTYI